MYRLLFRKFLPAAILGAAMLSAPAFAAVTVDEQGWTVVTPSADSRIIYVSSSEGLDTNNGLSPETPKKTIAHAQNFIRNGYPDHLLLKRGDVFEILQTGLSRWKSGRSADEPILVSYYGNSGPRPLVEVIVRFVNHDGDNRSHQYFIGIDFYKPTSDPSSDRFTNTPSTEAFRFVGSGSNILVEDCRLRFVNATAESLAGEYSNITFRRNIVSDTWSRNSSTTSSHTTGIYFAGLDGYLVEENFFDHCGWNEQIADANANMYAHNVYIQYTNKAGGIYRGNISARSAAHGAQLRSGGIMDRNLFVLNAIGVNSGGVADPTDPNVGTFPNTLKQNVVLNGRLMDPTSTSEPRTSAVYGIDSNNHIAGVLVEDNIVSSRIHSGANQGILTSGNPVLVDNIVYKWQASQDMFDASWPNPDVDLGDYYASLGGENDTIAYLNWQRNRPIRTLPWEMTSYAAINHIRAGFNKEPVEGYFDYPTLAESIWAEWPRDEEGYVSTGDWLGWLHVGGEWAFSYTFEEWMYLPEAAVTPGGAWAYISRPLIDPVDGATWADWTVDENGYVNTGDWFGWLYVEGEWAYSYKIDGWMYLPESAVAPDGAWAYINR